MIVDLTREQIILVAASMQVHLESAHLVTQDISTGVSVDLVEYENWRKVMQETQGKLLQLVTGFPAKPSAEGE